MQMYNYKAALDALSMMKLTKEKRIDRLTSLLNNLVDSR